MGQLFGKKILSHAPLEGYNLWSETYDLENNPIKNFSDSFIKRQIPDLLGLHILDAGCGTGTFCKMAIAQGATKVVGIDLSPAMTKQASIKCPSAKFITGSLSEVDLELNDFDVVVCALVLGHIEILPDSLPKLINSLKKGGILVLSDFHPFQTLHQGKRTFKDKKNKIHEVIHHEHLFSDYFKLFENRLVVNVFEEQVYNKMPVAFGMKAIKL